MLNSAQAKELFQREAVLLGPLYGVPLTRVAELFGEEAAHSVIGYNGGQRNCTYYNVLEVNGRILMFAYLPGFLYAASLSNVAELCGPENRARCKVIDFPGWRAAK